MNNHPTQWKLFVWNQIHPGNVNIISLRIFIIFLVGISSFFLRYNSLNHQCQLKNNQSPNECNYRGHLIWNIFTRCNSWGQISKLIVSEKYNNSSYINSTNITGHILIFKGNERKHIGYQINQNGVTSGI